MGLRDRLEHRREEHVASGRRGTALHYRMRQRLVAVGDDFWITDNAGKHVFRVDGRAMRLRDTLELEDAHGTQVCRIQTRALHLSDKMAIEDPDGERLALVHKALVSGSRERWTVELSGDREWSVQGNVVDHEYEIRDDGHRIAEISKRWFRVPDTYGVEIAADQDQGLVLAVAIAVDAMAHPTR